MERTSRLDSVEDSLDPDEMCGCYVNYGCCKKNQRYPISFFQRFAKPQWALTLLCCVGFLQGFVVSGLVNVVVTTIEKRFGLNSAEAGLIISSYNIASCIVLPFLTYIGGKSHKPLFVGWGMALMGIGCFLFSMPHFLSKPYTFLASDETSHLTCFNNHTARTESENHDVYIFVFVFAHILNGIGAASLYTLGMTYLDENVDKKYSSLYHGIYFSIAAALGPASGYVMGGVSLKIYTEIGETPSITNTDSAWVGAWWLGFVISGALLLILCVPIMMFPRDLPYSRELRLNRISELHQDAMVKSAEKDTSFGRKLKDLPKSALVLLRNPAFLLVSTANALDFGLTSGFAAFTPKYLESVFSLTASEAAYYLGVVVILGGSLGYVAGGIIISKADLSVKGMMKMCILSASAACICGFGYFFSCSNTEFAGSTTPYTGSTNMSSFDFQSKCNENCSCSTDLYNPVCGADGKTYFSSCFAGCTAMENGTFIDCSCIQGNHSSTAMLGKCKDANQCNGLVGFLIIMFGLLFFTVLCWTPALQIVVRVVPFHQRSFAVGVKWVIYRCFGGIPVPILFGKVFDLACAVWSTENGEPASCRVYFNRDMGLFFLYLVVAHKVLTISFYSLAVFSYIPPKEEVTNSDTLPPATIQTVSGEIDSRKGSQPSTAPEEQH